MNKHGHKTPPYKQIKMLKVRQKYQYDTCVLIHKFVQGDYPPWLLPLQTIGNKVGIYTIQMKSTR